MTEIIIDDNLWREQTKARTQLRRDIRWKLSIIFYAIQLWLSHCFGRLEQRRIVITESHFNLEHCSLCNRTPISDLLNNLIFHIRRKHKNSLNGGNRENKYCSSREIHFIVFHTFRSSLEISLKAFSQALRTKYFRHCDTIVECSNNRESSKPLDSEHRFQGWN